MVIKHQPLPKYRVVLLPAQPFVFAERKGTMTAARDEWRERYFGGARLLGLHADRSCTDPTRLFFTPRHPEGATEFCVEVIAGTPIDLEALERVKLRDMLEGELDEYERVAREMGGGKGGEEPVTVGLKKFMAKNAKRFNIATWLQTVMPDDDRGAMASGSGRVFMCPNDDSHTDAGNPDDKAFFVIDAADALNQEKPRFVAKCKHDSCAGLDGMAMLDLLCQKAGVADAEELGEWCFEEIEEKDEPSASVVESKGSVTEVEPGADDLHDDKPYKTVQSAEKQILKLALGDLKEAFKAARKIGAMTTIKASHIEHLIGVIAKQTKIASSAIRAEMKMAINKRQFSANIVRAEAIPDMEKLNEEYAIMEIGGKSKVMRYPEVPGTVPSLLDVNAFKDIIANKLVISDDGEGGKPNVTKLFDNWMEWPERTTFRKMVFEPSWSDEKCKVERAYNIYQGLPTKAVEGDWGLLRDHVRKIICHDNQEWFEWFMSWMADSFQNPGRKLGSAVVVKGKKGTGKSKLFDWLATAHGNYAVKISSTAHLTGKFNGHQSTALLVVCEEAMWAGDNQLNGPLKDLITSEKMMLEKKGIDAISVSNYARFAFTSNEEWVVPASLEDERRFFVLQCLEDMRGDLDYFEAIDQQMKNGGLEAMVYEMMHWNPPSGSWNILRKPPKTPWLAEQGITSLPSHERFILKLIRDGQWKAFFREFEIGVQSVRLDEDVPVLIKCSDFQYFLEKATNGITSNKQKVSNMLHVDGLAKKYLLAKDRKVLAGDAGLCYRVASLSNIRQHLQGMGIDPEEHDFEDLEKPKGYIDPSKLMEQRDEA
jgi:hypothetical protein